MVTLPFSSTGSESFNVPLRTIVPVKRESDGCSVLAAVVGGRVAIGDGVAFSSDVVAAGVIVGDGGNASGLPAELVAEIEPIDRDAVGGIGGLEQAATSTTTPTMASILEIIPFILLTPPFVV